MTSRQAYHDVLNDLVQCCGTLSGTLYSVNKADFTPGAAIWWTSCLVPNCQGSGDEAPWSWTLFLCCDMPQMVESCNVYELFYGH